MSRSLSLESSGAPEDKKIFFKGLEKCLEAFTSGEGRVVRKYARLFSQLSGKRQEDEDEAISWSSSEEDAKTAPLNSSIVQRSKITRKLNSQINFDSRIRAKENGRRLTRAEFSRKGHLTQDPLGLSVKSAPSKIAPANKSLPEPETSESLLNAAMLLTESQDLTTCSNDLTAVPRTPRREHSTCDHGVTSPVFKLNSSINKKRVRGQPARKSKNSEMKSPCIAEPLPSVNIDVSTNRWEPDVQLTPERKTVEENFDITSPVLGQSANRSHRTVASPLMNNVGDPSVSPIMLKPVRRKRRLNATVTLPASPILEPKKKAFKRKKRKLGVLKGYIQSPGNKTLSSSLGVVELPPSFAQPECPVKRSLDFAADIPSRASTDTQPGNSSAGTTHRSEEAGKDLLIHHFCEKRKFQEQEASQGLLNATNQIEEVNSEELDLSILAPIPSTFQLPNRLSVRGRLKKTKVGNLTGNLETIKESSQPQCILGGEACLSAAPVSEALTKRLVEKLRIVPSQKPANLDQTNLIEEVCTEELDLSVFAKPYGTERDFVPEGLKRNNDDIHSVEISPKQGVQLQSLLEKYGYTARSKVTSKSVKDVSDELHKEFRTKRVTRSSDRELIISQSSTRSDDLIRSSQAGCSEIESISSPIGQENQRISGPSVGILSKDSSTRSPSLSSPLVISSAGSSPDVRNTDVPFVILEDEYNAPPKRRSKKLDPNGIAARLQRLLNQRRSTARIWQYKNSKLSRLNNNREEENIATESRGRVLKVSSVRTDFSHIVLFSKEDEGIHANGKEFRSCILVVLDPGVVVRLTKVMNATKIKIFPPWQCMDLVDRDMTVILGANIVEVLSTERGDTLSLQEISDKLTAVQKYTCRCLSPPPPDAVILECWDGVQSLGILEVLFPLAVSSSTQFVNFDGNSPPTLQEPDPGNFKRQQAKYSIKALLSTQSTASHGKGVLTLTVLRVFCYRQRSFGLSTKTDTSLHWSIIGRDDWNEVCELVFGKIQTPDAENRCDWSDFISDRSLGKKYKFRGVAVSQRLDRSRFCAEWSVVPENQRTVYILAPSNHFSFSNEESADDPAAWQPQILSLANHVGDVTHDSGTNKPVRVSFVCRIFHVNEHALYVTDLSISSQLCSVVIKQSTFIPPAVLASVQKPKPTRVLVFLQDVEASKGNIVADKYSRIVLLDESGRAYPLDCCRKNWPANTQICSALRDIKVQLPQFSPRSQTHNLVKLTGIISDLDDTSALMWPACGSCGSAVSSEASNVHHCAQDSTECKQLLVHMSLIVFVQCPDFPKDVSIRVKILHKTVQALLRTLPQEGQDISVREALGKRIGPIRCEVTASHGGSFVLNEVPSSLWM